MKQRRFNASTNTQQQGVSARLGLCRRAALFPLFPAGLAHVLVDDKVPDAKGPGEGRVEGPGQPAGAAQEGGGEEPGEGGEDAGGGADEDLPGGVVAEVDAAPGDEGGEGGGGEADEEALGQGPGPVGGADPGVARPWSCHGRGGAIGGPMTDEEKEGEGEAPKGDKLGVRRGHAVALAVDAARTVLLDETLEGKVDGLAGELAGKGEGDFGLARREDERRVDDAEGLRDEGEVCAAEGDGVVCVLDGSAPERGWLAA